MAVKSLTATPARTGLTGDDLHRYFDALARAVDRAVPTVPRTDSPRALLARERLRAAVWIHQVYRNPLSSAVFEGSTGRVAREARCAQSAALARRLAGLTSPASAPPMAVRAIAATAALWAVTEDAVTRCPRPPREQVVTDAWGVMQASLSPGRATSPLPFIRATGAW
ncbi:hypothetical protein AB5J72_25190 [Streptomyces sp. CG1]|uniref:hypothetical protein n=1 Tax=Streptomyces sp. CG1 TaxID=1287523 RepID=UPI0034E28C0E